MKFCDLEFNVASVPHLLANPYVRWAAHPVLGEAGRGPSFRQYWFFTIRAREKFFGGAAGGGKTHALLAWALEYVDVPNYSALILRRTFKMLELPKSPMDLARQWLTGSDARWDGEAHTWWFPNGARLVFGHMETEDDKYNYQSAEFQRIGFDEKTQFTESMYSYMASRVRRMVGMEVPTGLAGASNPHPEGRGWVKDRFITDAERIEVPLEWQGGVETLVVYVKGDRVFVPSLLDDNDYLDRADYEKSLMALDYVTRRQLRFGDWDVTASGNKFKREWFQYVDKAPYGTRDVRFWDLAGTKPEKGKDPDYTAGGLLGEKDGQYYLKHVRRLRDTPKVVEEEVRRVAEDFDGPTVPVCIEQEPGSAGVSTVDYYARDVLKGYPCRGLRSTGDKVLRANPVSAAVELKHFYLVKADWNEEYVNEMVQFPDGAHDDQVDMTSGAFQILNSGPKGPIIVDHARRPR